MALIDLNGSDKRTAIGVTEDSSEGKGYLLLAVGKGGVAGRAKFCKSATEGHARLQMAEADSGTRSYKHVQSLS